MLALWFEEYASPAHRLEWKVKSELYSGHSPFQKIEVLDTEQFGTSLVLDGIMQTTEGDEFIYHEMLAFVPLSVHPAPSRVLIIGGGDGGLARDVLKDPRVEEVVLVEIDQMVVEVSRKFLPKHTSALDDPRLELILTDGATYLDEVEEPFDIILVDSTDPEGTGPGAVLYTTEFHQKILEALTPEGIFVQQTGASFYNPEISALVTHDLVNTFPICRLYWCTVPTYPGSLFTFTAGSRVHDLMSPRFSIDWPTRWYTPKIHQLAFALPPLMSQHLPPSIQKEQT